MSCFRWITVGWSVSWSVMPSCQMCAHMLILLPINMELSISRLTTIFFVFTILAEPLLVAGFSSGQVGAVVTLISCQKREVECVWNKRLKKERAKLLHRWLLFDHTCCHGLHVLDQLIRLFGCWWKFHHLRQFWTLFQQEAALSLGCLIVWILNFLFVS